MNKITKGITLALVSTSLCFVPQAIYAADNVVEQIVITAQKRKQNASDVGIAVTAFSGEQMAALGIDNSHELIAFTPGVSRAGDIGGQRSIFNIRGVVQNDYADLAESPIAVYIDGGYLASTQAQSFGLFDIARVEILKGPQGTLFGRNATGGLVNTITAKPTDETQGYADLTVGNFQQIRLEFAASGALSTGIRGRFSGFTNQQGEMLQNIYVDGAAPDTSVGAIGGGEDTLNDDSKAFRGQLEFDIGEGGTLLLSANWADAIKSEGAYRSINTTEVKNAQGSVIDVIFATDDPMGCDAIQSGACIDGNGDGVTTRPVQGSDFNGNLNTPDPGRLVD
ncbi:MAG: TonB-dependent receptor plug domain-containing protein, partial [Algicola sp.]|nr:TonB-dependent receptor plug domain-containing protein [Algicola sp.]